jgi:hypothetical protein
MSEGVLSVKDVDVAVYEISDNYSEKSSNTTYENTAS